MMENYYFWENLGYTREECMLWDLLPEMNIIKSSSNCSPEEYRIVARYYEIEWLERTLLDQGSVDEWIEAAQEEILERKLLGAKKLELNLNDKKQKRD